MNIREELDLIANELERDADVYEELDSRETRERLMQLDAKDPAWESYAWLVKDRGRRASKVLRDIGDVLVKAHEQQAIVVSDVVVKDIELVQQLGDKHPQHEKLLNQIGSRFLFGTHPIRRREGEPAERYGTGKPAESEGAYAGGRSYTGRVLNGARRVGILRRCADCVRRLVTEIGAEPAEIGSDREASEPLPDKKQPPNVKELAAMTALLDDPSRSPKEIAEIAGCHRSSLYRMKRFRFFHEMMKSRPKRGAMDASTGNVEPHAD